MVISQYLTSLIPPLPLPSLWQARSLPVHQLWKSLEPPSWSYFLVCIYSFTHYLHLESSHIYPSIQAFLNLSSWKCLPVICSCYLREGEFQGGLVASHAIAQLAQNSLCSPGWPQTSAWSSCFSLLKAVITGGSHHIRLFSVISNTLEMFFLVIECPS